MDWSFKAMQWLEKIIYIVVLNALWVLGVVFGLGILGIFPATYALFQIFYDKELFEPQTSIFMIVKKYINYYYKSFFKANAIGFIYTLFIYFLYVDWKVIQTQILMKAMFYLPLLGLSGYLVETFIFLLPITILGEGTWKKKIKLALIAPLLMPKTSLLNAVILLGTVTLSFLFNTGIFFGFVAICILLLNKVNSLALVEKELIFLNT